MSAEQQSQPQVSNEDFLVLGHLVKYNLYMLAKSIVFAAILEKRQGDDVPAAIEEANAAMEALDLDSQRRKAESTVAQEPAALSQ